MTDLKLDGIREPIAGLIRDAPVDEKAQLVLGFEWPSLTGPEVDPAIAWVGARLDLVLLTWDPFAAYDDETMDRSFSITPVGDDCRLQVQLALGRFGSDAGVGVLDEISRVAESFVRACARHQPRIADAGYLATLHADVLLEVILAARQETATLPPPDLRVVSDGWVPIDHQLLMNMSAAQFGPMAITLEPIPPAVFDPIAIGCPACEGASYADVFELELAMDLCSQHRAWRNAQHARVLGDAQADDPEGLELLLDVIARSHLPHVPYPLYARVMAALVGDVSLEESAAAVIDLCEWAGSPERFEAGAADLGFEPDSLDFSDFLTHVPFRLGLDGQFERAEEVLDARAMAQGDGEVHYGGLALELARAGRFDEADRVMERALSSVPPPWLTGLAEMEAGEIAELRHDRESAEASYEDAIRVARLVENELIEADAQRMLADLIDREPGREPDAARARRRADELMKRVAAQMPAASVQEPVRIEAKVGRNEPCPCESGRKFKHCHGA